LNLIITSAKGLEARASAEFKEVALLAGIRKVTLERSAYDGIVEVEVENPKALLAFLSDFVRSEPFKVRFIMRAIPIDMVVDTIRKQSPEDWTAPYSDPTEPRTHTRFACFLRMAAHAYHHTGQIIYLAKELTKA